MRSRTRVSQTMRLAPRQIPVNAHVNLKDDLTNSEIVATIAEIEAKIKEAEPKVDMIFLETAGLKKTKHGETGG